MIDIDKIEAAASADKELDEVTVLRPAIVMEMVSMIRERDAQVVQLQEQNTMLDAKLSEVEAVLKQALSALERTETYLRIEVNEAYGRDAHVSTITEWQEKLAHHKGAIAAIKGVLNERSD